MNKKLLAIGLTLLYLIVGLSGCNEPSNNSTYEKSDFIGTWMASEESHDKNHPGTMYYTWSFYKNDTVLIETRLVNETFNESIASWNEFQLKDEKLIFEVPQGSPIEYTYSFSEDKNELTLTKNNISITFTKIESSK